MIKSIIIDISVVLGLLIGVPFLFIYILAGINVNQRRFWSVASAFGARFCSAVWELWFTNLAT